MNDLGYCALAASAGAGSVHANGVSPEKRAEIERLLEVTGALAMAQQVSGFFVAQITDAVRKKNPQVPQHVIDALPEEVNAVIAESLPETSSFRCTTATSRSTSCALSTPSTRHRSGARRSR